MAVEWVEILARCGAGAECPVRMRPEWIAGAGELLCRSCGNPVHPHELFFLTAYCAMGGAVPRGEALALYSDLFEVTAAHVRCKAEDHGDRVPECLTIGHGTRPLQEFVGLLQEHRVGVLADIRTVPRSRRNPQYGTESLAQALPAHSICYLHLAELGGLRKPRKDSPNAGWRNESFRGYADYMLTPPFRYALEELIALARLRRTAIMCAESVYWRCHRSLVADALLVRGIPCFHIMGPGEPAPHRLTSFARPQGERLVYPAAEQ
jgi:hypothetical protein